MAWQWGGWAAVFALVLAGFFARYLGGRPVDPPAPSSAAITRLTQAPAGKQSEALTELSGQLANTEQEFQLVIVQANPNDQPLVVANVEDADGDEEITHWPVPWPGVRKALQHSIAEPTLASSTYAGAAVRHRLIPLDDSGTRVLVVNSAARQGSRLGSHIFLFGLAGLLSVALLARSRSA